MSLRFIHLLACLLLLAAGGARAGIVVIVNPDSGIKHMTREDVVNVYMGRYQALPSGNAAFPLDLGPLRADFYTQLVDKSPPEINSYWARLVFSGRASPPRRLPNAAAVLEAVADNKGAIGYLKRENADSKRVRIVYELSD